MKEIISETELENFGKRLTNHSGRKTLVKKLKEAEVPESSIIKVTGHKSTEGLKNYDPADQTEFRKMSEAISNKASLNVESQQICSSKRTSSTMASGNSFVLENCNVTINNYQVVYKEKKRKCVIYSDSSQESQ